ncbi:MAG: hypothetical protein HOK72_12865 [Flavobacteriales bacterium]|jgi:hypothetical protein|nr:hypothetical protein [Flavobacteriales bacterium]
MGVLELGPMLIPNPEGFDNSSMETLAATLHLLNPINYITVFLAHSLGALVGAAVASLIAANRKLLFALVVGVLFLTAGLYMSFSLPSPNWYIIVDSLGAYIPMSLIAWKLTGSK